MTRMGESLFDLEKYLRTNKVNPMTLEEANIIMECKAQALRGFVIGTASSSVTTWLATWKMNKVNRVCVTTGVAGVLGFWWFGRSLDSCVDHILSLEGKRIKDEMAKIVLIKYRDNPSVMKRVSKHFYSENVYDDNSADRPKLRWRVRTVFSDPLALERMRTHVDEADNEVSSKESSKESTTAGENIKMLQNQAYIRNAIDSIVDPFDHVFGLLPQPVTENPQPDASTSSVPRAQSMRSQRRSRRRHRRQHHEMSED